MPVTANDAYRVLIELGAAIVGLAILARLANRWALSAIPLYLLAKLAFGNGGLAPLNLSENFIKIGAEIGVLLLRFAYYTPTILGVDRYFGFSSALARLRKCPLASD